MEQRLEAAANSGDVTLLRQLLGEDTLLLHGEASHVTPLHIAASLGHLEFVREVLAVNPGIACSRNGQGLTALHLAAKQGHLSVVKELLQACGENAKEVCSARDNKGFMPVHTAAVQGRIDVLKELLDACPESAQARTSEGDSIFHLAAKSNSFETVQFLIDLNEEITAQLLNSTDDKGNTALHAAVARKQLLTVKLLLRRHGVQVSATNKRGCTALDVIIDSPRQHEDLVLVEMIRAAGGKTAAELRDSPLQNNVGSSSTGSRASHRRWQRFGRMNKEDHGINGTERYNNQPGTMMVVATLIATITFQAGLSAKEWTKYKPLDNYLEFFLLFDMIALFASLSIILLLICCVPRKKKMVIGFLKWILWLSVFFTALAFSTAVKGMFESEPFTQIHLFCWFLLLCIFMVWVCFRAMRCLLRRGGCWKDKFGHGSQSQTGPTMTVAIITKAVVGISLIIILWVFVFLSVRVFNFV